MKIPVESCVLLGYNCAMDLDSFAAGLRTFLKDDQIILDKEGLSHFSYDATERQSMPQVVLLPETTEEVSKIMKLAWEFDVPVTPQGGRTGLSGGGIPLLGGAVLSLLRFKRIVEIDEKNMLAVVEPGVISSDFQQELRRHNLFFPPDPSSTVESTLGGNVAENAGYTRAVKYGVTRDYVLGLEAVLPEGEVIEVGRRTVKNVTGYDMTAILVGSEGTLAIITKIIFKLLPRPKVRKTIILYLDNLVHAADLVVEVFRAGIIPCAMELVDNMTINAIADYINTPLKRDADALVLIEVDGHHEGAAGDEAQEILGLCGSFEGVTEARLAATEEEAERFWITRREALPALKAKKKDHLEADVVVPRYKLPFLVKAIGEIEHDPAISIATFGHAGDGNLHVTIMHRRRNFAELDEAYNILEKVYKKTIEMGGSLTGEHGVGITVKDYLGLQMSNAEIALMKRIKKAFDPKGILNPGKIFADNGNTSCTADQTGIGEEKYRFIVESTDDAVYMVNADCMYVFVNEKALAGLGLPQDAIIGKHYDNFHTFEGSREFRNVVTRVFETGESHQYEHRNNNSDRYFLRTLSPVKDPLTGKTRYVTVVSKEITELKKTEEKLKYLSLHDVLTGLYNRAYFEEEMHRIDTGRFDLVGLILCDIDGLKLVNDTLGHDRGDELIRTAARILRGSFRESDVVARVGGDEFAILLPNSPRSKVESICARIKHAIASYNSTNPKLPLSVSTGYAVREGYTKSVSDLYREADNNMYKEKLSGSVSAKNVIIRNLIDTVEEKGRMTREARERFLEMVIALATVLGLPEERIKDLRLLAQFHDIGNAGIHEQILLKPECLTQDEILEVHKHTDIGHRIAQAVPELAHIADFILKHHEWWNGNGYPLEEIPLESRIIALVSAYDAMTNPRPHRGAMMREEAIAELRKCSGTQFDPLLVEKFIEIIKR